VAVPGNPEWALPKISSDWKNMNIRNKPSLLHISVPLFCILLFGCGIPKPVRGERTPEQQVENTTGDKEAYTGTPVVEEQVDNAVEEYYDPLWIRFFGQGRAWSTDDEDDAIVELTGDDAQYAFLYDIFLKHTDELLRNEMPDFQDIWLCPDPAFDSRRRIVLKDFPLRTKYPWRLSMYYQNIDDDNENELVMLVESADGNNLTMKAVILVDDSTHGYALLDVVRPYFVTGGIEDTYLFNFAKKYYGKLVNFRTKDAINIVALSCPPAKSAFGIFLCILEIRGGKIKTILDESRIYMNAYDFFTDDVFQTSYRQAVNAYKDKTGNADMGDEGIRLTEYAMPSFEDRDNDGSIEIIIEGSENLFKVKDKNVDMYTFYPEDWEVLMPVNQYKKIYAWDEAEEQYVLQSEARTEYVKLDVN
jgi:hypothetical protein